MEDMTPLLPGILDDILKHPDEDGPRLVAADWWEEHGEVERAEFIRVQIALAKMPEPEYLTLNPIIATVADYPAGRCVQCRKAAPERCLYHVLRRRERELLELWGHWTPRIVDCAWQLAGDHYIMSTIDESRPGRSALFTFTFRRGFVHALTCTAADWLAHAAAIRAQQPVQAVTLTTWPNAQWSVGERPQRFRFGKRGWRSLDSFPWPTEGPLVKAMLAAEWPGIAFTLPTTVDFGNFAIAPPALPHA